MVEQVYKFDDKSAARVSQALKCFFTYIHIDIARCGQHQSYKALLAQHVQGNKYIIFIMVMKAVHHRTGMIKLLHKISA